jgi:hypothetical protein
MGAGKRAAADIDRYLRCEVAWTAKAPAMAAAG